MDEVEVRGESAGVEVRGWRVHGWRWDSAASGPLAPPLTSIPAKLRRMGSAKRPKPK